MVGAGGEVYKYKLNYLVLLKPQKLKGGICSSHYYAITYGMELQYLRIFYFSGLTNNIMLRACDTFFGWTYSKYSC